MIDAKPRPRGNLKGKLAHGEVVSMMSDNLFKKVYADVNHLERIEYLLSNILEKEVKVIRILNNELIGDSKLNSKKIVDLICQVEENEYVNIEVNTMYEIYYKNRNLEFLFRLASTNYKADDKLSYEERKKLRRQKKKYIQINLNEVDTNNKPFAVFSITDTQDVKYQLTDMVKIININVSYYKELCYTKDVNELSDIETAIGVIGIHDEKILDKVTKKNDILKGIGEVVKKYSWEDDLIVARDREEEWQEAMEVNVDYAVEKTSKEIAKKMLGKDMDIESIAELTGLSIEEIEKL